MLNGAFFFQSRGPIRNMYKEDMKPKTFEVDSTSSAMGISLVEIRIHVYLYGSQTKLNHVVKIEVVDNSEERISFFQLVLLFLFSINV